MSFIFQYRRYGVVDGRFVWEGGSKSGRGSGVHVALSDTPNEITRALDLASRGALNSKHKRGPGHEGKYKTNVYFVKKKIFLISFAY